MRPFATALWTGEGKGKEKREVTFWPFLFLPFLIPAPSKKDLCVEAGYRKRRAGIHVPLRVRRGGAIGKKRLFRKSSVSQVINPSDVDSQKQKVAFPGSEMRTQLKVLEEMRLAA